MRYRLGIWQYRLLGLPCAWIIAIGFVSLVCATAEGGPVNTAVYSTYADNFPNGVQFSGSPVDNISTADFQQFGSAVSWNWHPDSLATFAADTVGYIQVTTADTFTFILAGAQQSYAFVDGTLAVSHGSDSVAQNQNTFPLTTGMHQIEVQYDIVKPTSQFPNDTQSGWELTISPANEYSITIAPEPASLSLIAAVLLPLIPRRRVRHGGESDRVSRCWL